MKKTEIVLRGRTLFWLTFILVVTSTIGIVTFIAIAIDVNNPIWGRLIAAAVATVLFYAEAWAVITLSPYKSEKNQ